VSLRTSDFDPLRTHKMKLFGSSIPLLFLLAIFTILTAPGTCHPLPKKHKYNPHGKEPDKNTMVDPGKMSNFACVQECVVETKGYLDVRRMNQHHFCYGMKGAKADKWLYQHMGGCALKRCPSEFRREIEDRK